jgi:hypothetical protein
VNLATLDVDVLRALCNNARQRSHPVRWVDRDGTARVTSLSDDDDRNVGALAHKLNVSMQPLLRLTAELPARRKTAKPSA